MKNIIQILLKSVLITSRIQPLLIFFSKFNSIRIFWKIANYIFSLHFDCRRFSLNDPILEKLQRTLLKKWIYIWNELIVKPAVIKSNENSNRPSRHPLDVFFFSFRKPFTVSTGGVPTLACVTSSGVHLDGRRESRNKKRH